MTKQDAKATSSDDDATFGDVEHQLPAAASAIDELVAVAAPEPADQTAIVAHVHEVQHAVGISVNAADDLEAKVPRVNVVRPHVLNLPEVILQHILTIIACRLANGPSTIDVLRRLDATKVTSPSVGGGREQYADAFGEVLAGFSALERLTLAEAFPSNFGAGTCHHLVAFHGLVHDETGMQQFAQWLGTARALKRLCLLNSLCVPLDALGSILPQPMQRGLEYCEFSAHTASPAIAELLANALMYRRRHARRLAIHLQTLALKVLLSALATCRNVTLHVMWEANDIAAANALVVLHRLRVVRKYDSGGGMFASPV
ncbi:hypothetical protein SPRG_09704 [Saprolegnia parasitica CBS 223.65]|uniref:F-box domain-containing protein n=1 Tax=Saprolegnia parasitica (strain CBS 223.65) TaxID=695850 RepID=A0A067C357_SAPPC|nr:hypothetical protein SPRG_09704 [Saprolegnia parasitica CBS 223.65]KDO24973.1 hypothetical protein SPRG_09704 [Saprolegnia parasitica CBS 223.65]|eukprot:XP_012204244.1 hypothetical protein SPRG_09704 [Saprolegnia parasitica CBS 223.65]